MRTLMFVSVAVLLASLFLAARHHARRDADFPVARFVTPDGQLRLLIQALVVASRGRRIVVDTCVGNDKDRTLPPLHHLGTRFLEDLAAAGLPRESIDSVVCTHLHVDHVAWNTMKVGGRWVPTFPNARYLVVRREWEHWSQEDDRSNGDILGDSVRPVFEAGLVDLMGDM